MIPYEEIKSVHLEMTENCNASCVFCPRNRNGGPLNPHVTLSELSLSDIKTIFNPSFLRQINQIILCGNYGDPAAGRDTLPAIEHFLEHNPHLFLSLNTNGSLRSEKWWYRLGQLLTQPYGRCFFSVDGLEDTNGLYRRGTSWEKILRNMKAFIGGGGNAVWEFLVFQHNQHQVEEAQALARDLGFQSFMAKRPSGFYSERENQYYAAAAYSKEGKLEYQIMPSDDHRYFNQTKAPCESGPSREKIEVIPCHFPQDLPPLELSEEGSGTKDSSGFLTEKMNISCKALKGNSIFISAEGLVFPCCWTAVKMKDCNDPWGRRQMREFFSDLDQINAKKNPLSDILGGGRMRSSFEENWRKENLSQGKLKACQMTCGEIYAPIEQILKNGYTALNNEFPPLPPSQSSQSGSDAQPVLRDNVPIY